MSATEPSGSASQLSPQPLSIFTRSLAEADPEIARAIESERARQRNQIELIASENIASSAVLEAQGSLLTNKYAEGYPGRRYYGGCEHVDVVESIAMARACELFECSYANVQPHSGSQANQGVFLALLKPGDTFLGMSLAAGGHLTHGAKPNQSGKWFNAVQYGVVEQTGLIDYDEVETLAREHQPRLIIAGGSAYPRIIDFARMRAICDAVGALLMVDMAHFAGLVAGRAHPNPLEHAHVVTTTTHKTLRGPRGGMILSNDPELGKKINSAIFPGLQGGPLEHVIAAKAVAFREAMQPEFRHYSERVVANARALGEALVTNRIKLVTDGTDTHLLNVDLRPLDVTGKVAEQALESVGLTCNKNAVPYDPKPPAVTSGVRLGSPAGTTRGFDEADFRKVGELIAKTLSNLGADGLPVPEVAEAVRADVRRLCEAHPIY